MPVANTKSHSIMTMKLSSLKACTGLLASLYIGDASHALSNQLRFYPRIGPQSTSYDTTMPSSKVVRTLELILLLES